MSGAVRQDGSTACMTVEGAVNAEIFRSYVREVLLPTMRAGDILVMDNLITDKDQESLRAFFCKRSTQPHYAAAAQMF
jgi:transposase